MPETPRFRLVVTTPGYERVAVERDGGMLLTFAQEGGPTRLYVLGPHGCDEVDAPPEDEPFVLQTVGADLDAVAARAVEEKLAEPPIANAEGINRNGRRVGYLPLPREGDDEGHRADVAALLGSWGVEPEGIYWVPGEMPRRRLARFDSGYWHGCPIALSGEGDALQIRVVPRGEPAATGEIAWLRMQRDPLIDRPGANGGPVPESDRPEIRRLTRRILVLEAKEAAKASGEWYSFADPAFVRKHVVTRVEAPTGRESLPGQPERAYEVVEDREGEVDSRSKVGSFEAAIAECLDWAESTGYIPGSESRAELEARLREDKCYTDGDVTVTIRPLGD